MIKISLLGTEVWERQYWKTPKYETVFDKFIDGYTIGVCESSSYQHALINKLKLYNLQNIPCGIKYVNYKKPFWVKPIVSIHDMGTGTYRSNTPHHIKPCQIWVKELLGTHRSIDFVLDNGKVSWSQVTYAHKDKDGFPILWEVKEEHFEAANKFVNNHFKNHNGTINLEMIDDKVLEVHCRPGTQYFDLYNIEDMAAFVIENHFNWDISNCKAKKLIHPCYSWVYYTDSDLIVDKVNIINKQGIKSIQKTYKNRLPIGNCRQRKGKYRILVINTQGITIRPKIEVIGRKINSPSYIKIYPSN